MEGVTPLGTTDAEGGLITPAVDDSAAVTADETEAETKTPSAAAAEDTEAEGC